MKTHQIKINKTQKEDMILTHEAYADLINFIRNDTKKKILKELNKFQARWRIHSPVVMGKLKEKLKEMENEK